MTLLLPASALAARKQALADPTALGGLAGSLQRELHQALDVPVPEGKSRLTRSGGRCPTCTVLLAFDPRLPQTHTCPSCGAVHTDRVHHEWWLMNGHLWTAEQCTRAATLAHLLDDDAAARRADDILEIYADRYLWWPNRDNALGPTRPFFSTYLESIWLLHLCVALDLREATAPALRASLGARLRERLVEPSATLIASFNEGRSNRQVWHAAALLAAADVLGDDRMRDRAVLSLVSLLREGLHTDGSWYEGENYHLFAHRGLLTAVTLAEQAGAELPADLLQRFEAGFASPFRTVLPDGSFPARRDSQYGVTLRQYRTADWVECGFARQDTAALRSALASLYAHWAPPGDTGRRLSTADAERNQSGVRLTRADCSWRALLLARLELPSLSGAAPGSELLEGQGLAIFRRDGGRFWVGLDYGDPGAGHGHPDRLNLVVATERERWLDDVGTGSYTSPTLAWYRSSMAHNAPLVNGNNQGAAAGRLLAHDEREAAGWVSAEFTDPVSGVRFVRTVVVMDRYLIDEVTWTADHDVAVDVPLQAQLEGGQALPWRPAGARPSSEWLANVQETPLRAAASVHLTMLALPSPSRPRHPASGVFTCLLWSESAATLWKAGTIGPPGGAVHGLVSLRQHGPSGRSLRVIASPEVLAELTVNAESIRVLTFPVDLMQGGLGTLLVHQRTSHGWSIQTTLGTPAPLIELRGLRRVVAPSRAQPVPPDTPPHTLPLPPHGERTVALDSAHFYRPTEESWLEAGAPAASVHLRRSATAIIITVRSTLNRETAFAAGCAENPLDNEPADVNSDGVQLHWRSAVTGGWNTVLAVPETLRVRLTAVEGTVDDATASWHPIERGYVVSFTLPWRAEVTELVLDCCVNERPAGRERRRGQLVMSGARGESAYLRGARQSPEHALHFDLLPDQS